MECRQEDAGNLPVHQLMVLLFGMTFVIGFATILPLLLSLKVGGGGGGCE